MGMGRTTLKAIAAREQHTMADEAPLYFENTNESLKLFYTILLTISVGQGIIRFFEQNLTPGFSRIGVLFSKEFAVLVLFLLIMARFLLGGVRHLDATYIEESFDDIAASRVGKQSFRALDFGLLALDALLLVLVGFAVTRPPLFFEAVTGLLLLDGLWGLFVAFHFDAVRDGENHELVWGMNNVAIGLLLASVFLLGKSPTQVWFFPFAGLVLLNSGVDLYFTRDYYFPKLSSEGDPVIE